MSIVVKIMYLQIVGWSRNVGNVDITFTLPVMTFECHIHNVSVFQINATINLINVVFFC